jgi:hypothetical protein
MELRRQGHARKQGVWTLNQLRAGFEHFFEEFGHYPTGPEIDTYTYLPSARSIEVRFGGLVALRKQLGIGGQGDYRKGIHSSKRAKAIANRAHKEENLVYQFLCERFNEELVHREHFFTNDSRIRSDFFIYDADGNFCVDVFYPRDLRTLTGCINLKLNKYTWERMGSYPVIFLQMNHSINQEDMDGYVERKLKRLHQQQFLMGWETFKTFCEKRTVRRLI